MFSIVTVLFKGGSHDWGYKTNQDGKSCLGMQVSHLFLGEELFI